MGTNVPRRPLASYALTGMNSSTTVTGLFVFQGDLIIVGSDRYVYRVQSVAPTVANPISVAGAGLEASGRPVFAEDQSDMFIAGGAHLWKYTHGDPTGSSFGDSPPTPASATHVAWLGQRLIANARSPIANRGLYYWSDAGDGSDGTWQSSSYANAEARPDEILAIYENTQWTWIFGASTLQIFAVGADATNPFDSVTTVNIGIGAKYSPVRIDSMFAFIDDKGRIVMSDGRSPTVKDISQEIVTDIRAMTTYADAWGWRETEQRYDLLCYHFPTAGRTFEYDLNTSKWGERRYYDPSQGLMQAMPISSYVYWPEMNLHVFGRSDTNSIATISATATQELGGELLCQRTVSNVDHGIADRKSSNGVWAYIRRGTTEDTTPGVIEIRKRDDGRAWSRWVQKSVGRLGDAAQGSYFPLQGTFRKRDYDIRYAGTNATSIVAVYDDITAVGP